MTAINTVKVRLSEEEVSRGGQFYERDHIHGKVNLNKYGAQGEVQIDDKKTHTIAITPSVRMAIQNGRLVEIGKMEEVEIESGGIDATKEAVKLAAEQDPPVDLAEVKPTGKGGTQVNKSDVQKYIKALKAADK